MMGRLYDWCGTLVKSALNKVRCAGHLTLPWGCRAFSHFRLTILNSLSHSKEAFPREQNYEFPKVPIRVVA